MRIMNPRRPEQSAAQPPIPQGIRVGVLDNHVVVGLGVELLVNRSEGFIWTGSAASLAELSAMPNFLELDILILDYQLAKFEADGSSLLRHLRARFPALRLLVYTANNTANLARIVYRAGAHGFIGKSAGSNELLAAIRQVFSGKKFFPATGVEFNKPQSLFQPFECLTTREYEVLRCFLQGMSVTGIALKFQRSIKTISTQKLSGYRKLKVSSDRDFLRIYN